MAERYFHHRGGFLTAKHLRFLRNAAKIMRTDWKSLAGQPTNPVTMPLIDACDAGKTPTAAVAALLTYR